MAWSRRDLLFVIGGAVVLVVGFSANALGLGPDPELIVVSPDQGGALITQAGTVSFDAGDAQARMSVPRGEQTVTLQYGGQEVTYSLKAKTNQHYVVPLPPGQCLIKADVTRFAYDVTLTQDEPPIKDVWNATAPVSVGEVYVGWDNLPDSIESTLDKVHLLEAVDCAELGDD